MGLAGYAQFTWNRESEDDLRRMYSDHLSDSQMAQELSAKYKVTLTRNGVIGKRHRLGLHKGNHVARIVLPKMRDKVQRNTRSSASHAPRKIEERTARVALNANADNNFSLDVPGMTCEEVTIYALTSSNCHWPLDSGLFCGNDTAQGPYCSTHAYCSRRKDQ